MTQDGQVKPVKSKWEKVVGEAALIVASVFVAISLEGVWQEYSDAAEARVALVGLLQELRADHAFVAVVTAEQEVLAGAISDLLDWFADAESLPTKAVHEAFLTMQDTGLTTWPRRAAWTTMVAAGHLSLLDDNELVARLGNHYEYTQRRLTNYERTYDEFKYFFENESLTKIWDFQRKRLLTEDSVRIAEFRNQILKLNRWNQWYLGQLMGDYGADLNSLIFEVEKYLIAHDDAFE